MSLFPELDAEDDPPPQAARLAPNSGLLRSKASTSARAPGNTRAGSARSTTRDAT